MRTLVVLSALVVLVALAPCRAQGATAASGLVGSWRLVAYEDHPEGGPTVFPYGREPRGFLIYDRTGHMAIQIMKVPHPKVASGNEGAVAAAEKQELFDAYVAYFGRYTVDVQRGIVTHLVEGDLHDVYIGRNEERPYALEGDRLVLKPTWTQDGKRWSGVRAFERIK